MFIISRGPGISLAVSEKQNFYKNNLLNFSTGQGKGGGGI